MKKIIAILAIVTLAMACGTNMESNNPERTVIDEQGRVLTLINVDNHASIQHVGNDIIVLTVNATMTHEGEETEKVSLEFEKNISAIKAHPSYSRHNFNVHAKDAPGYTEFLCIERCKEIYVTVKESNSSEALILGAYVFKGQDDIYNRVARWTLQTAQTSNLQGIRNVDEFYRSQTRAGRNPGQPDYRYPGFSKMDESQESGE